MKGKETILATVITTMFLAGCSSTPTKEDMALSEVKADKIRAEATQAIAEHKVEKAEEFISNVPAWALVTHKPDDIGLYAVGIGESEKLQTAIKKSQLEAQFELASLFGQEIAGSERGYTDDTNSTINGDRYTQLIDKIVDYVPVQGFETVKKEVSVSPSGNYVSFVLLKLPYAEFNRVLQSQKSENVDGAMQEAFADLERRLEARRQQRLEEAEVDHNRKIEVLNVANSQLSQPKQTSETSKPEATDQVEVVEEI